MRLKIALLATALCPTALCPTALWTTSASAQSAVPASELPGFQSIQLANLRRDLTYVSSDEFQGRMSLQPGDDLAIKWIASRFAGQKAPDNCRR